MKKQYRFPKVSIVVTIMVTILIGIISCEDEDFRVVPEPEPAQTITAIEPMLSDIGTTVVINGTNFSRVPANNKVSFNGGILAIVSVATDTTLTVTVPEGATTGPISVKKGQINVEGPVFNVVGAPAITDLSTTGAAVGETITIRGNNFGATVTDNIVQFNGVTAEVTTASSTEITVIIPDGATTGPLTVEVFGQVGSVTFTITPTIISFDPTVGIPGAVVTIIGTNFSPEVDKNRVSFNGSLATVNSATTTELKVIVPAAATTGPIAVEVEGLLAITDTDFTIDSVSLIIPINDANDDVEEAADGRMTLDSSDLELGEFDTFGTPDLGLQKIGLRFNGITIPAGVTIASASIQFVADSTPGADPTEMTIFGENVGNAAAYDDITPANSVSGRVLTSASVVWNIPEWTGSETGPNQKTVDISSIVQEIVNRGDWADGNSMNFILQATGVSAGATANNVGREAETFESGDGVCVLNIVYIN
ncbi:IPT/TIG domain-containing protein [Aquimarina algiphila]|uniref:IPT/TIG domain-containing protein n=1 Tax=Aquimarina algiphila TaxID=2047982 RepID=UPI002491CE22|nr:IPT/TIG domain-containing protein [Aquimarina algiphila]